MLLVNYKYDHVNVKSHCLHIMMEQKIQPEEYSDSETKFISIKQNEVEFESEMKPLPFNVHLVKSESFVSYILKLFY
mgnify:CR=1 FL=1